MIYTKTKHNTPVVLLKLNSIYPAYNFIAFKKTEMIILDSIAMDSHNNIVGFD